ncbi:MAG: biotin/lipoyl-binding protein [Acidobacteria bacterium]|nr:biotin/lipoyl-binding protein [Acidobacteriota bacterium]
MKRILIGAETEKEIEFDPSALPFQTLEDGTSLVLHGARVHRITHAGRRLLVNGKEVSLTLADPRNRRRNGSGKDDSGRRDIKAAMPGKVVKVLVEPGQAVDAGAGLLILEAMKMQNEVRSPGAGAVGAVRVTVGDTVASGQVLVTLE